MKFRNVGLVALVVTAIVGCDRGNHDGARVTQSGSGGGAAADPWNTPAPAKDPLKKPLLWKVEKDGNTSYLLGTIHVGVDPTSRLPDVVWQKLDEKPIFAMETDLSDASKLEVKRSDGTTLEDEIGPEYWKKLEDALGAKEASAMLPMKPMIPATLLSLRGLPKTAPMDGVLHGRASNAHKQIVYLEALEVQSKMLDKWMNARALK
ncbi:MAG TPA: TraB/GumN family protein, partial [Kofleriaceae bacterium]|nr:TraB/GumN family protein [Kofleriaceae bacterium]